MEIHSGAVSLIWVVDLGCFRYIIYIEESFSTYNILDEPIKVITASGAVIQAIIEGII
jgi:hypothetical protein